MRMGKAPDVSALAQDPACQWPPVWVCWACVPRCVLGAHVWASAQLNPGELRTGRAACVLLGMHPELPGGLELDPDSERPGALGNECETHIPMGSAGGLGDLL